MSIKIMNEVWDLAPVDQGSLLVLLALADCADEATRTCYPGVEALAKRSRLKPRQVKNCLARLRQAGIIECQRNASPLKTNLYRLTPSETWAAKPDVQFLHPPKDDPEVQFMHARSATHCPSEVQSSAPKPSVTSEEPSDARAREKEPSLFSAEDGDSAIGRQPPCHAEKTDDFEEWWKTYPKSRNRPSKRLTQQKFRAALKKVSFDDLMRATRAYASECEGRDPKYVAQPTTWLNQERWEALLQAEEPVDPRVARLRHMAAGRAVY